MKLILLTLLLMFSNMLFAATLIDLYPLQLQFRYQDTASQAKEAVQYQALGFAAQQTDFRIGFEYSFQDSRTGNSSLSVETKNKEYSLFGGYRIFEISLPERRRSLDIFVNGSLGSTQSEVTTQLLSSPSTAQSDKNSVIGASVAFVGRVKYFSIETEFKLLNSKNFSPQTIPVAQIKLGATFPY